MRTGLLYISILILVLSSLLQAQSLPIFLDGRTDDWNEPVPTYTDNSGDGSQFDFHYFSVTNDELFLFIRLNLTPEMKLLEDNQLALYIDGDNNSSTGLQVNGIGAELEWNFGQRDGTFYKNGNTNISFADIMYRSLPTVTDTTYEIAIGRDVQPNGIDQLFSSQTIKIFFKDKSSNGDWMPNGGEVFEYTFDDTPTPPLEPIDIARQDTTLLRVMNYNVLQDGLLDPNREQYFTRILQAIQPDIMCFNELFNATANQVNNKINEILPLPNGQSWYAVKLDFGNVTVSKYPVIQSWVVYDNRITASLIDLPSYYNKDILVINSHLKCCGGQSNDETRQREADAIVAFILDAKSPGGTIDLPEDTPFIILGDLNLVGQRQQLTTLITGQIINTQLFGNGAPPDWDNTDLEDLIASQTDRRTAYTWRNDNSSFPPGRLDFQIYSNSSMNVSNAFVLQTEIMSQQWLAQYGLQQNDTKNASDHFPKVTDYNFTVTSVITEYNQPVEFRLYQNYPNPFNPTTKIKFTIPQNVILSGAKNLLVQLKVYDVLGNEVATLVDGINKAGTYEVVFNATGLPSGVYFYQLRVSDSETSSGQGFVSTKKLLLLK